MAHHNEASFDRMDSFDNLSLIDVSELPVEDETEWLRKAVSRSNSISTEESGNDRATIGTDLLSLQFGLLSFVKDKELLLEEKPEITIKDLSPRTRPQKVETTPSIRNTKIWERRSISFAVPSPTNSSFTGDSTPSVSANNSPTGSVIGSSPFSIRKACQNIRDLDASVESENAENQDCLLTTPTPPKTVDKRTYTRPKKPTLEGHLNLKTRGLHNTTFTISKGNVLRPPVLHCESNRKTNLNETYTLKDSDHPHPDKDKNRNVRNTRKCRKIKRNLSSVIRRGSIESQSTKESPVHDNKCGFVFHLILLVFLFPMICGYAIIYFF